MWHWDEAYVDLQAVTDCNRTFATRGAEKEASAKQRGAAKERARLDQARSAVEEALAELEAAQRAEQEAQAIAKESAAEVRCVTAQRSGCCRDPGLVQSA